MCSSLCEGKSRDDITDGTGRKRTRILRPSPRKFLAKSNCFHHSSVACSRAPHIPEGYLYSHITIVLEGGIGRTVPTSYGRLDWQAKARHWDAEVQTKEAINKTQEL